MLKLFHPLHLLFVALTYALGASIANYLGETFLAGPFWLGMLGVLLAQTVMSLLPEVFRLDVEPLAENESRSDRQTLRNNVLYVSTASLASLVLIFYSLFVSGRLSMPTFYFLVSSLMIILLYSVPPFRLGARGFGEIFLALHLAYIIPAISFTLQSGETHRFLIITIPLTFLAFAYFLVINFQTFAHDQKFHRITFLTRLGWERVISLHHIFVVFAYIFFLAMTAFGLTLSFLWPAFLTFPFALYQIFQLRNISLGLPPNWKILNATALSVFGLTTYFLTLTFWIR